MAFGLKEHIINKIQSVFEKYIQLEQVILFGSRAKGNYSIGSDIDLTLVGDEIDYRMINKIENDLDDLMLPYSFDVSLLEDIENENLLEHINRVGTTFFKRNKK